jgi:hypothetical protein
MDKDEVIDQIMDAIAEDFTFREILDVSYMRRELDKLIQIEDSNLVPLLFGALQLKTLHRGRRPLWQALCPLGPRENQKPASGGWDWCFEFGNKADQKGCSFSPLLLDVDIPSVRMTPRLIQDGREALLTPDDLPGLGHVAQDCAGDGESPVRLRLPLCLGVAQMKGLDLHNERIQRGRDDSRGHEAPEETDGKAAPIVVDDRSNQLPIGAVIELRRPTPRVLAGLSQLAPKVAGDVLLVHVLFIVDAH